MRLSYRTYGLVLLLLAASALPAASQSVDAPLRVARGSLTQQTTPTSANPSPLFRATPDVRSALMIDEVEPNNSIAQAQVLQGTSPFVVNGAAESSDVGDITVEYNNNTPNDPSDDVADDLEDLYSVTTTAPGLTITLSGFNSNLDLVLLDPDDLAILGSSTFSAATAEEQIEDAALPAGTYVVAVNFFEVEGATGQTNYQLSMEGTFASGAVAEIEPNNSDTQAQRLEGASPIVLEGTAASNDMGSITYTLPSSGNVDDMEDLFSITTTARGLRVVLSDFTSDMDVYILNPEDLVILGQSNGEDEPEEINVGNLPPGDYLIAVSFFDADGTTGDTPYRLRLEGTFSGGGGGGGNSAPTIAHQPAGTATAGQTYSVTATLTDDGGVQNAMLRYRQGGATDFTDVALSASGDTYTGEIPANAVTANGLEYTIRAADAQGLSAQAGPFYPGVTVGGDGLQTDVSVPSGDGAYRLISVPLDLSSASAANVLQDDLGSYDETVWRFYGLQANQEYAEFPSTAPMTPGRAFWLALKETSTFDTGAGTSVSLAEPFSVSLSAGWNLVGNPFNFDVPIANVRMSSGQALDIRAYNGSSWSVHNGPLQPFAGYAIFAEADGTLLVAPTGGAPAKSQMTFKSQQVAARRETAAPLGDSWDVRIRARAGRAMDDDNVAAVHPDAAFGRDRQDRPEPPVIGDYVSAYFVHPEPGGPTSAYSTDARAPFGERETWALAVRSNTKGRIDLHFGVENVPEGYSVWLVDEALHIRQNLRARPSYTFTGASEARPKALQLVVERTGLSAPTEVPERISVSNYPNPFNQATTVHFGLPKAAPVTLTVHDALGRQVATLVDGGLRQAGFHSAVWDGRNNAGQTVASGLYLYRLHIGESLKTGSMVLLK